MTPERWAKIEGIFQSALDLSGDEREEFLRRECGGDADLRREVDKFIARFETEDSFLESPVWTDSQFLESKVKKEIASSLKDEYSSNQKSESIIGRQIGVYKLVKEIGKGGMGEVFLAERADGEFNQRVAIKLIKRGMDTDFIVRRFRNERQIAAALNHPNIARLLDGGTTADDLPYFVLEYVEGEQFFKYANNRKLNLRQKLELFVAVCRAIIYAHRKKIIHRDIKPGNILVSDDGEPKLLDFGIAKILDSDLIHESQVPQTGTQMRLMTPEYASPEQVRGEEITTASDQYSLGVLLYELITGNRPYKFPSRSPFEIARVICEEIPSEPSSGDFDRSTDENGGFTFDNDFCKKLDRIVLKTLRKNPVERYASVEALAADIESFLRNESVRAESFTGDEEKFEFPPAPLVKPPKTNAIAADKTLVAEAAPRQEQEISSRWTGIKQGFFIIILAFLELPILIVLTVTSIIPSQLTIFLFLFIFLGGIIRLIYALLFEPRRGALLAPETEKSLTGDTDPTRLLPPLSRLTAVENRKQIGEDFAAPDGKTIAVLPFKDLSALTRKNTDSGDFLSVGLADALITRLSSISQFIVRPTSSILKFAADNTDESAAGDKLKVQFLLVGNILRVENKIRVSVQMLDTAKQQTIWAERFNEELTDVLTLEDKISERVVNQLLPQLSIGERAKLKRRGTDNSEAHDAYLRGRFHWNTYTEEGFRQAYFQYQRAVELDPNYAQPHAAIADYYNWLGIFGALPAHEAFQSAKKAARRAVEIDETFSEAYASLGTAVFYGDYDWRTGEKHLLRAIELNPGNFVARIWYSHVLHFQHRFDESIEHIRHAVKLDPVSFEPLNDLAWNYYFARRSDEAFEKIAEVVEKFPLFGASYYGRSHFLRSVGRMKESLEFSNRALELSNASSYTLYGHAQALAAAGKLAEAEDFLERMKTQITERTVGHFQTAIVYLWAGEPDKVFSELEKSLENREAMFVYLFVEPIFDKLRGDARFAELFKNFSLLVSELPPILIKEFASENKNVALSPPSQNQKSIAVLPFKFLKTNSGETTDSEEFLGIGLADALIIRLSSINQLIVRPTSSILKFGADNIDEFAAGKELKAQFLIVGNILRSENRIRVSVQLLDAAKQRTVWAERFTENLTDVLTLEDKISEKVAELLVPQLSTGEREKLAKRGTEEPKAYEAYLRGRFYRNMFSAESLAKAFAAYREAISYDPNYALAYAGIADYYIWLGVNGVVAPTNSYPLAKEAARRAIELDDNLADAYASLAFAQICGDYDWIEAEKNSARAVEISPNYSVARLWHSYVLLTAGRFDESLAEARRAVALDPLTYVTHHVLALNHYMARRFDEAVEQVAVNVKNFAGVGMAYQFQSWVLRNTGSYEEAVNAARRATELSGESLFLLISYAQAVAAAGRKAESEELLWRIYEQGKNEYLSYYQIALIYVYLDEKENALAALERAYEDREGWLIWVRCEPALDKLRDEPRFINLRKKIDRRTIESINDEKDEDNSDLKTITGANKKSIAVLPFKILDNTADAETDETAFLGIGLADALIIRLSNARQMIVRPTSSVLRYGANDADSFAAGNELKVEYVLDGNIIRSGKRIRVSVQLLSVAEQSTVWAERFDEDLTDVLTLEDSISARVAESIVPRLTMGESLDIGKRGTNNADAYEAFLRGRVFWNTFTEDGLRRAVGFYEKAIALDPDYAQAHAAIADYYVWLGMYGLMPTSEFYPPARKAANRAIELDPNSSEAYAALGLIELYGKYNWLASERNIRRALELNPNNPVAYLWFTHTLYSAGRFAEGKKNMRRSLELEPLTFQNNNTQAWGLYFERRFDEALEKVEAMIEDFPNAAFPYFGIGCFSSFLGRADDALRNSKRASELSSDSLFTVFAPAQALAVAGKTKESLEIIGNPDLPPIADYHKAIIYCYLKDREKVFERLESSFAARESTLVWLGVEPSFDFVRDDERYQSFLNRINHPLAKAEIVSESATAKKITAPAAPLATDLSDAETIVQTEIKTKKRISPSIKFILAAFVLSFLSVFGFIVYQIVTHTTFNFSAMPSNREWKNNFASLMNVKLLTSSGKEQLAAVAPDGSRLAFVSEKDETNSLWIRQIDAENAVQLVAPEAVLYVGLKFSPDGKYVYYTTSSRDYAQRILWRIAVDAANNQPQKVLDNVNSAIGIAPDGKRIAYYNFDSKSKLMNMLVADLKDDSTLQSLKIVATRLQPDYFLGNPAFSPDGNRIVYPAATVAGQKETVNLYEFNFAANAEKKIGERDFNDIGAVEWRENGTELVISANEKNTDPLQLWLVSYPSGEISRLTNDLNNYYGVSLTKNSDALVTIKRVTISNVAIVSWEKGSTFNRLIIEGVERQDGIEGITWTADNRLLYISSSGGKNAIALTNADGTNSRIINVGDALPSNPLLTGDGRFLFFIDQKGQESKLRRYETATGAISEVIPQYTMTPTLTPDDKYIIYSAFNAERKTTLHRVSIEGSAETELTSVRALNPFVSPDNKFIAAYYTNDQGEGWRIGIFPITGGAPVNTLDPPETVTLHSPLDFPLAWSSDSRRIYYVNDKGGVSNIFRVSADGANQTEQITNFPSGIIFDFALSPDQQRAAVARGSTSSDVVLFKTLR